MANPPPANPSAPPAPIVLDKANTKSLLLAGDPTIPDLKDGFGLTELVYNCLRKCGLETIDSLLE